MGPDEFLSALAALRLANTFNPYADRCAVHDAPGAPKTRRKTLLALLNAAIKVELDSIWIGRDLGYRGGRRTGLALTDDVHIRVHAARWGLEAERPTKGQAVTERTAAVIWSVLSHIDSPIFLWNVFPLHPHESGDPFSNRSHNATERETGEEILAELICLVKPRRLIAIGNDAARSASRLGFAQEVIQVRHPSYGGQTDFIRQIRELYGLREVGKQASLL
jgi:hypothetical protein